jgi:glycosyltransferase involved in cell wall biosynthesis
MHSPQASDNPRTTPAPQAPAPTAAAPSPTGPAPKRPEIVSLTNVATPYRLALHRRIDAELPELQLLTIYPHDQADQAWTLDPARTGGEDRVFRFGKGESVIDAPRLTNAFREWSKGGEISRWLAQRRPAAMLLCGYNDVGRLRVLRACNRLGIPIFLVGDSNLKGERAAGLKAAMKRLFVPRVIHRCFGVMPCGSYGAQYFLKYGATTDRIYFVPYEPDYDLIQKLSQQRIDEVAKLHSLRPERRRIVFCGRMIAAKRPDLAVDAFAAIAADRPDFDLIMIGDGDLRRNAEGRVPSHLRARVRFTGFLGNQEEISAIYRASDVFVLPSTYEPWGVVINEAVAAGMAVVATDSVGAAGELVRDGVNGRTFPSGDLTALTAALKDATDPDKLRDYKIASAGVLADWRDRGDPVKGIRKAMVAADVLHARG